MFQPFIDAVSNFYPTGLKINNILGIILGAIVFHKFFYLILGMLFTRKFKPAKSRHLLTLKNCF